MAAQAILAGYGNSDPYWASVVALLFNDNAANGTTTFADQSTAGLSWARTSGAAYTTSNPPTGMSSSVNFGGSGQAVTTASTSTLAFGTNDFTFEYFVRINGLSQVSGISDFRANGSDTTKISVSTQSSTIVVFKSSIQITGSLPSNLTWAHYAFCRSGSSNKFFLNGVQTGSTWTDSTNYGNAGCTIANVVPLTNGYTGQMASFRITKGVARYTGTFTVPAQPFPTHA